MLQSPSIVALPHHEPFRETPEQRWQWEYGDMESVQQQLKCSNNNIDLTTTTSPPTSSNTTQKKNNLQIYKHFQALNTHSSDSKHINLRSVFLHMKSKLAMMLK